MPDHVMPLALLSALLALALPASASAYSPPVERGLGVGAQVFGPAKCGQASVVTEAPDAAHRGALAWVDRSRCAVVFNATPPSRIRTPERRCMIVTHEYGHLAGREHSPDPRSVMYAQETLIEGLVRLRGRWAWQASGYLRGCARSAPISGVASA